MVDIVIPPPPNVEKIGGVEMEKKDGKETGRVIMSQVWVRWFNEVYRAINDLYSRV